MHNLNKPSRHPRKVRGSRLRQLLFLVVFACLSAAAGSALAADTTLVAPKAPKLEIPIPNVNLTEPLNEAGYLSLPWLGQYISGVYRFMIGIVGMVAAIMMVVGGFQYITSAGDKGKLAAGKKRITDAFIGLVLALGSYVILYAINPNLVEFKALQISTVQPDLYTTLGTTKVATAEDDPNGGAANTYGGGTVGGHPATSVTCPLTLTQTAISQSRVEFRDKMGSAVTAASPRERVVQIADLADACDVNWGSCGETAGSITALAGIGQTGCLSSTAGSACNDNGHGRELWALPRTQRDNLLARRCGLDADAHRPDRPDCFSTAMDATKFASAYLLAERAAGRLPKDWPDGVADRLQPGDRVNIYNGNPDLTGSHAVIFMGWKADGVMQVVQGGAGGSGHDANRARPGVWCVKTLCKEWMVPIVKIWSAD